MGSTFVETPIASRRGEKPKLGGRYVLEEEIARGGVGVVLRARDSLLHRDVAIKRLRPKHGYNGLLIERLRQEAQIGAQLRHPGIVPVIELGFDDGMPYLAMQLIEGRTLAWHLAAEERPSQRRLLSVFEQACRTIAYAHAHGVVHRDIKPSNIMVGAHGEVMVLDWGIARYLGEPRLQPPAKDGAMRLTARGCESVAGTVLGTPAYMAPEQATGHLDLVDERADVFALGAVLCELLGGRSPYPADGEHSMLQQAQQGDTSRALADLRAKGVSDALVALVATCLEKDPAARPRGADAVADAVAAHLAKVEARASADRVAAAEARGRVQGARRTLMVALSFAMLMFVEPVGDRLRTPEATQTTIKGAVDAPPPSDARDPADAGG